jgi:hypothetical protein
MLSDDLKDPDVIHRRVMRVDNTKNKVLSTHVSVQSSRGPHFGDFAGDFGKNHVLCSSPSAALASPSQPVESSIR